MVCVVYMCVCGAVWAAVCVLMCVNNCVCYMVGGAMCVGVCVVWWVL